MKVPTKINHLCVYSRSVPKKYYISLMVGALFVMYAFIFFVPKQVNFSFADVTCVKQLTLFPNLHKTVSDRYTISYQRNWQIGNVSLVAMKSCFTPTKSPKTGTATVGSAPLNGVLFRKLYAVTTAQPPSLKASIASIPTTKPLRLAMTMTDTVHAYSLSIANGSVDCSSDNDKLACNIPALKLRQGKEYTYTLSRRFNDEPAKEIQRSTLKTLSPMKLTDSSLKKNGTVYSKPKKFEFTFDKPVAVASLRLVGDKKEIPTKIAVDGKKVIAKIKDDLARQKSFSFKIQSVEAKDGSTLLEPYTVPFKISGGPKVTNVSAEKNGVSPSAGIILSFDQKLSSQQDMTKLVSFAGGNATVQKLNDRQLRVQLQQLPLCKSFTISVAKGIKSNYDIKSSEKWSFTGRTSCSRSEVIGYSVKGRPITAYYFGSGSTTVLFTGGMHGEEQSGTQTMQSWVDYLDTNAHRLPKNRQIVVVPNTNPDGIAANQRYNAHDVNIDRNFPTSDWQPSAQTANGKEPYAGGKKAASEPETRALMALTSKLRPRLEVSFHAQGSLVGANKYADSVAIGNSYARQVGYATVFSNTEEAFGGYAIYGEYEEWMGQALGVPAILIELPTHSGNYFSSHSSALWHVTTL